MALSAQRCEPCRGDVEPMSMDEAKAKLAEVPGWEVADSGKRIVRCFNFKNFTQALEFVNKVGQLAEQEQHHPDITFGWGYATIEIFTHKIGGLHQNDFILASKINALG